MKNLIVLVLAFFLSKNSFSQTIQPVIYDVLGGEITLYDAEYEEASRVKSRAIKQQFMKISIESSEIDKGLVAIIHDEVYGMLQVALDGYEEPVWIDETSVLFTNTDITSIDCPVVTSGLSQSYTNASSSGMSDFSKLCVSEKE